ncbi:MAG TPA: M36 family metallopeptidase [Pyrinomonadaceae bacterium]|jgi:hypothetical protein
MSPVSPMEFCMKMPGNFLKSLFFVFVFSFLAVLISGWQFAPETESAGQNAPDEEKLQNYDIRADKSLPARAAIEKYIAESGKSARQISAAGKTALKAAEKLRAARGNLKIEYNEDLRVPEIISPGYGVRADFLTAPSGRKRTEVLKDFLRQNAELFGVNDAQISELQTTADYTNPNGVLSFVHFEQKIGNIPVFRGEVKAGFTRKNEIVRIINNLAPNLDYENLSADFGNAGEAVLNAATHIGVAADESDVKMINSESDDLKITFGRGRFSDKTIAEKMYFPLTDGVARAAWRVLLWTRNEAFYVIVDAASGELLWRKNITENQTRAATFSVYGNLTSPLKTADSPTPLTPSCLSPLDCPQPPLAARQSFTLIGNEPPYAFNNLGWIPDNGLSGMPNQSDNITDGNAVEAGLDRVAPNGVDAPVAGNPNRVFSFNYNPAPGNPPPGEDPLLPEYQKGSVTHAFYVVNRWHDEMYLLGFTEQARNYQHFNFGRGGAEGDRISAEIQDAGGTNNANFSATADGVRPRMQMYLWTNTTPNRDGALDAQVLVHETTHGLSNRLHGNSSGLSTPMAAGLGEGWSDLYPLSMLSEPTDNVFSVHAVGGYAAAGLSPGTGSYYYGARRFPYALKAVVGQNGFPHNPLTLAHLNQGNCSTFNSAFPPRFTNAGCGAALFIGEVWATALWEVRGQFVLRHGSVEGNRRALQIITDAMKLSPLNPTILQSRDAVLAAAQANSLSPETGTDVIDAWRGFALRGFGTGAQILSTNPVNVVESYSIPSLFNNAARRADFDGDRKADVSVFRPSDGVWYLNQSTNGFAAAQFGISTDRPAPEDYDGDGKTDFGVFRDGNWYLLRSNTGFIAVQFGAAGDIPQPADFDGDGRAELAVFRRSNGSWYVLNMANTQSTGVQFGADGDKPVVADYDGDGKADYAVYRPADGVWYLLRSQAGFTGVQFGIAADKPVVGDYDGDGKADQAVYRNGIWYLLRSTQGFTAVQFGIATDLPAPADYDGDGKTDPAVYRDNTWYLLQSTGGFAGQQFGALGDKPVPNAYVY